MICDSSVCYLFFKQKTADVMRISDWSSDVCSSDLTISQTIGPFEKAALDMMTGYMIYDSVIGLFFVSRFDGLVIFHHVLGLLSHGYSFYLNSGMSAFYLMMVYLADRKSTRLNSSH